MLLGADNVVHLANNYRVVYLSGRYGGGKTAFSFRLAYELCKRFNYRYILSNVRSVWCDDPEQVVFRDGCFLDSVLVLDEGGLFLDRASEAKQWLAMLRKLNVVLIIPSVVAPALMLRTMTVQRVFNWSALGVPIWSYAVEVRSHPTVVKDRFHWWGYSEIFGVYDTLGMPADADILLNWLKDRTEQAAKNLGYDASRHTSRMGGIMTAFSDSGASAADALQDASDAAYDSMLSADRALSRLEKIARGRS
jgi:hypothetical protein